MPSVTLGPTYGWAVGETISVYERDSRNVAVGAAITTAAVGAASTVTFTLDADLKLIATDGTYAVRFGTLTDPDEGGGTGDVTESELTDAISTHSADSTSVHGISDTSKVKGVVVWTSGGVPSRPSGFTSVEWVGPDDPAANSVNGDTWIDTA